MAFEGLMLHLQQLRKSKHSPLSWVEQYHKLSATYPEFLSLNIFRTVSYFLHSLEVITSNHQPSGPTER